MFLEPQVCPAKADKSWYGDKLAEVKEGHDMSQTYFFQTEVKDFGLAGKVVYSSQY